MTLEPGIHHDAERRVWALAMAQSAYALGVTPEGFVQHLYWGPPLADLADLPDPSMPPARSGQEPALSLLPEEYPAWGGLRLGETTLRAVFADSTRELDLRFAEATPRRVGDQPSLTIVLRDAAYPLSVTLEYRLDTAHDCLTRAVHITNAGTEPVRLERAFSGAWHLPRMLAPRHLLTLAGQWGGEMRLQQQPIVPGTTMLEARHGLTGHQSYPWMAIESAVGEVYFVTLAWSGNWALRATTEIMGTTTIVAGIHDLDFAWPLAPGATFTAPDAIAGFAADGREGARHRLHAHIGAHIVPQPQELRPVLSNSWEATLFAVDEPSQMQLADQAAGIGVELFVMDDGWFLRRTWDDAGLGDWIPDPVKFPRGLGPLIQHVHDRGMLFGLWVEPEMVNPDSDLYRAHPDWVYHFPRRPRSASRNQLVLNLARDDVRDHIVAALDDLLTDNAIDFLKWDMNRPFSEVGWPDQPERIGEIAVRHVEHVYAIIDTLRQRHPQLRIETCASGGGRMDLGMLRRTDEAWVSDNTRPDARLAIQAGISHILPARVQGAWVTDTPALLRRQEFPLDFRFHVAMLGVLGIGGNLLAWSDDELATARHWIAVYRDLRPVIQAGEQTWLASGEDGVSAVQYRALDNSQLALFVFRLGDRFQEALPPFRLRDLAPAQRYHIRQEGQPDQTFTGSWLMGHGLYVPLPDIHFASALVFQSLNRA